MPGNHPRTIAGVAIGHVQAQVAHAHLAITRQREALILTAAAVVDDEPIAWAKPPGYIQAQPVLAPHLPSAPRGIAGLLARIAVIVPLVVAVTLAVLVALVRQNGGAGNGCHGGTGDPCSRVVAPAFLALRALGQAGQDAETPAAAALDPHLPAAQVIAPVLVVAAVASQGLDQLYLLRIVGQAVGLVAAIGHELHRLFARKRRHGRGNEAAGQQDGNAFLDLHGISRAALI